MRIHTVLRWHWCALAIASLLLLSCQEEPGPSSPEPEESCVDCSPPGTMGSVAESPESGASPTSAVDTVSSNGSYTLQWRIQSEPSAAVNQQFTLGVGQRNGEPQ